MALRAGIHGTQASPATADRGRSRDGSPPRGSGRLTSLDFVRELVAHGADTSVTDSNGNTAAVIAALLGHEEISDYLEARDSVR